MQALICDRCGKVIPRDMTKSRSSQYISDIQMIDGVIDDFPSSRMICKLCYEEIIQEIDSHTKCYCL